MTDLSNNAVSYFKCGYSLVKTKHNSRNMYESFLFLILVCAVCQLESSVMLVICIEEVQYYVQDYYYYYYYYYHHHHHHHHLWL
jgi:hypothetical protein